jgi:hypothetical protein
MGQTGRRLARRLGHGQGRDYGIDARPARLSDMRR